MATYSAFCSCELSREENDAGCLFFRRRPCEPVQCSGISPLPLIPGGPFRLEAFRNQLTEKFEWQNYQAFSKHLEACR